MIDKNLSRLAATHLRANGALLAGFCVKRLSPIGQLDDPALCLHRCAGFSRDMAAMFQGGAGK